MKFAVYLPPQTQGTTTLVPAIYFLSGLTCTEQNFITKVWDSDDDDDDNIYIYIYTKLYILYVYIWMNVCMNVCMQMHTYVHMLNILVFLSKFSYPIYFIQAGAFRSAAVNGVMLICPGIKHHF